jgi:hypothetical protein
MVQFLTDHIVQEHPNCSFHSAQALRDWLAEAVVQMMDKCKGTALCRRGVYSYTVKWRINDCGVTGMTSSQHGSCLSETGIVGPTQGSGSGYQGGRGIGGNERAPTQI